MSPSPRRPVTFFLSAALSGDGKQLWRPPGGAGVDEEVAASAQLSKKRRGEARRGGCKRRGKGANFIPTTANHRVAFLFGHSPVSVPFDQFLLLNRRGRGRPSRFPLSLSPFPVPAAAAPAPLAPICPGPPRAAGKKAKGAEESPGDRNSGREGAGRQGKKLREAGRKKVFGGGVFCASPDAGLRRGLPSPCPGLGRGPPAGDGRGLPPPRAPAGKTSHICG